ncbi:MAG TPA: DUF302 domain-containing protein [Candidatus Paceibacterota bacterium]|nr:DUF302 domain-containing protein [Candidatus Paceibacterota bacterium]
MKYDITKKVPYSFAEAITRLKEALTKEGFGVLAEIDIKETMQKKLGIDYENYMILGVCNPPLAHEALQAEKKIGLFLPCNIIVYEDEGMVVVSAILPTVAMSMLENTTLTQVAVKAEEKLQAVINNV